MINPQEMYDNLLTKLAAMEDVVDYVMDNRNRGLARLFVHINAYILVLDRIINTGSAELCPICHGTGETGTKGKDTLFPNECCHCRGTGIELHIGDNNGTSDE